MLLQLGTEEVELVSRVWINQREPLDYEILARDLQIRFDGRRENAP